MANKPLKTIKFPGLDDTYTVPQVDAALATSGAAADAKKVGDELSDLKQDYNTLSAEVGDIGMYTLGLYPQKEVADVAVASFADGADDIPVKSLTVDIEPVQSGSGDPSPSNVRPISGWTWANVSVNEVNQWDEEWELGAYETNGGTKTPSTTTIRCKNKIALISGASYYIKTAESLNIRFFYYGSDGTYITTALKGSNQVVTFPTEARYVTFHFTATTYNNDMSINYPSTDTAYHAYKGNTYPITFPSSAGTVYGGTLDVTNGVLTVTYKRIDLGTLTWMHPSSNRATYILSDIKPPSSASSLANVLTEKYKQVPSNAQLDSEGVFTVRGTDCALFFYYEGADPSGDMVYELATPVTYQLTPTEVTTLLKNNNIFADTGNVAELTYRADLKAYIDEKLA